MIKSLPDLRIYSWIYQFVAVAWSFLSPEQLAPLPRSSDSLMAAIVFFIEATGHIGIHGGVDVRTYVRTYERMYGPSMTS